MFGNIQQNENKRSSQDRFVVVVVVVVVSIHIEHTVRVTRYEYFSNANYSFVLQLFKTHLSSKDTYRPPIEFS